MSSAQFFDSLPASDLLPMEAALRQVLVDWLHAKPGPFPLIEWIDRRIGGEVVTTVVCEVAIVGARG